MTEKPTVPRGEAALERNSGLKGVVVHHLVGGIGEAAIAAGLEVKFLGAVRLEPSPEIKDYFRRMEAARQRAFTKSFRVGSANDKILPPAANEQDHGKRN